MTTKKTSNENDRPKTDLAKTFGNVAVGCSNAKALIHHVMGSAEALGQSQAALENIFGQLRNEQGQVTLATEEARALSQDAQRQLERSSEFIQSSMVAFTALSDLIIRLENHFEDFGDVMASVRHFSQSISRIAQTTDMLALNAAIEAYKVGDAGSTFSVLAKEVKKLATDTKDATKEIVHLVSALDAKANSLARDVHEGGATGREVRESIDAIRELTADVEVIVRKVGEQNSHVADSSQAVSGHVHEVHDAVRAFAANIENSHRHLDTARQEIEGLDRLSNEVFDEIVHQGLSLADSAYADRACAVAREIERLTDTALDQGELDADALFDRDYVLIKGSRPPRYTTGLTEWADDNWRPVFDEVRRSDVNIGAALCSDVNGFMPTHITELSQPQTGDAQHDTEFCRNGRIALTSFHERLKQSRSDYVMAVYRHEADGSEPFAVRTVFVPVTFGGMHWGYFELAYVLGDTQPWVRQNRVAASSVLADS